METRQANQFDLQQLAKLFNQYRIFYKQESDIDGAVNFISERFRLNDSHIIVALNDSNAVLGFTQLYPSYSSVSMQRTYILNDLFVSENFRKKGVGEVLLKAAKQFSNDQNSKGLTLETDNNNPAQHLYERLKWKKDTGALHYTWMSDYED